MVIPSLAVKIGLIALAGGGVGTAIAVPVIKLLNAPPPEPITVYNFPALVKGDYQNNCQVMISDNSNKKYLLVCDSSGMQDTLNFYFYVDSNGTEPVGVEKIIGARTLDNSFELTLQLIKDESTLLGLGGPRVTETIQSSSNWSDLKGVKLGESCNFKKDEEINDLWKIQCKLGDNLGQKNINLIPLIIK